MTEPLKEGMGEGALGCTSFSCDEPESLANISVASAALTAAPTEELDIEELQRQSASK